MAARPCGYCLDPVSLHHTNRSSPKSEICETSLMYRSASVLGSLATRAAGEAAALASLPIRSASPTLRLFVGRGPVSGVTDADATTRGSSTTPVLAGSCNETSLAGLRVSKQLFLLFVKYKYNKYCFLLFTIPNSFAKLFVIPNIPLVAKKHYLYLNSQIVKYQIHSTSTSNRPTWK